MNKKSLKNLHLLFHELQQKFAQRYAQRYIRDADVADADATQASPQYLIFSCELKMSKEIS